MTDFPEFRENAMASDNIEGSQQDENVILYYHWHRTCAAGIAAVSAGCAAWLQLVAAALVLNSNDVEMSTAEKLKRKATIDVILQSVGENIASSLDNVSRAIVESAEILANKMACPYDRCKKLFTSLQALDLSEEYLLECYVFLAKHEAAANKFLGIPQQFRKEILTRIMISASVSK